MLRVSKSALSCWPLTALLSPLLLHIFPKWCSRSHESHLVPKAGQSLHLTLVGALFPCPLVPHYEHSSLLGWVGGWGWGCGIWGLLWRRYELPMASVDWGRDSWEADRFPASLASMYLSACSRVMAWLGSPKRSI